MALRGTLLPALVSDVSAAEVSNYTFERFTHEPDLWRIHVRTVRGLLDAIELTTVEGDGAARAIRNAEYSFLTGLFSVGVSFGILIAVMTF